MNSLPWTAHETKVLKAMCKEALRNGNKFERQDLVTKWWNERAESDPSLNKRTDYSIRNHRLRVLKFRFPSPGRKPGTANKKTRIKQAVARRAAKAGMKVTVPGAVEPAQELMITTGDGQSITLRGTQEMINNTVTHILHNAS